MPVVPKAAGQRQRRNKTTTAATLEAGPAVRIDLPTRYSTWQCVECGLKPGQHTEEAFEKYEVAGHDFEPKEAQWQPMTVRWWDTIWASPMVAEWVDADVPDLLAIALMVDDFWRTGDSKLHAEIRMSLREYGLSPLSRRSLQWEIKRLQEPPTGRPAAPVPVRRGRARLGILEGGQAKAG